VRAYTCTGTFFQSIPLVAERMPEVLFVCPGMAGETEAERWVERLKLNDHVVLLPGLPQSQLWGLFSRCPVSVSLTTHDGTPNTLLEAMACGSFPIAGDIESLREWLIPGQNGLLVEPQNPAAAAEAIVQALENDALRQKAVEKNLQLIQERAEVNQVRPQVQVFYQWVWGLR
jgi:glycosyltransferase involved in cell wall biosynthesis